MDSARSKRDAIVVSVLMAVCRCAFALDPSLDINQYGHTAWTIREGFFKGTIHSIAQTPDGYLWLGTEFGLLRFDGVRAVSWIPPGADRLRSTRVTRLLVAHDGTLWIGTDAGLASWNGARLIRYRELDRQAVYSLLEDRDGTVWAGSGASTGRLCAIQSDAVQCFGQDGSLGRGVLSLYEENGNLWAGAESGLWRWRPGPPKRYAMPLPELNDLIKVDGGPLLIATHGGIRQLIGEKPEAYPIPGVPQPFDVHSLLRDRNGGLWIGTNNRGIFHLHEGRTDVFSRSDGLSDDFITSFFEDREGNVWVATTGGLDRFREFAVSTISVKQGLSSDTPWSVLATRDGSVWVGARGGLNRWNNGRITIFRKVNGLPDDPPQSLFQDDAGRIWLFTNHGLGYWEDGVFVPANGVPGGQVHAIAGDGAGNLLLSEDRNLLRITAGRVVEQIPWSQLGAEEDAITLLSGGEPGGLWFGFRVGRGLIYFKDGQIRQSYQAADGLSDGAVAGLMLDRGGALWAATAGGLSVIQNGKVQTLTAKSGLPCDTVHWVMDDDNGSTWLYLACGLARLDRTELDAWKGNPNREVHPFVFDSSDGVMLHLDEYSEYSPRVAKSGDGRLWFVTGAGVSVVDPRHLPFNKLPPPVHIEEITADRKIYWQSSAGEASSNVRLPPLVRDLEIDYTALSLVAPEKIRFRYKLEGHDADWQDAANRREAFYNDLPPRNYRFRVAACNNSGVWNEAGASLDFSIAPAYYQTPWFLASCVAAFLVLLWGLYRLRLHQIAQQFNARLDERVNERTRIARDLHDTLLQSFHGLMFRFQAVRNMLPRRSEEAIEALDGALDQMEQAIAEGRDAIQGLRSSTVITNELALAVTALGKEMSHEQDSAHGSARFHVVVEGAPRDLHPILRDEVYAIAREAVRNAFRHSQASNIEADITYNESSFQLRIRDDGKGMDPGIVREGRAGHYGMPGLRERAKRIGGKLDVWTAIGAGTEIELSIPGSIAYGTSPGRTVLGLFRKKEVKS